MPGFCVVVTFEVCTLPTLKYASIEYRLMRYSTMYVDSKQLDRHSSNSVSLHIVSSVAESADCCESCCCSHVVVLDIALFQWMLCFLVAEW